jgi:hypothetical protein
MAKVSKSRTLFKAVSRFCFCLLHMYPYDLLYFITDTTICAQSIYFWGNSAVVVAAAASKTWTIVMTTIVDEHAFCPLDTSHDSTYFNRYMIMQYASIVDSTRL